MTSIERWLCGLIVAVALLVVAGIGVKWYGAHRYDAGHDDGYAAAVAAGKAQHDRDAAAYQKLESEQRAQNAARDADAYRKEQENATNLEAAQRRVRAGTDRLRCPAAGPVQPAAAAPDRPAAGAPTVDGGGPDLVPEAASDVLGYGAAIAGLVSRYAEVVERHEDCRAVNAK